MWEELVVLSRCLRGVTSGERSEDVSQIAMPGQCSPRTRIRYLAVCSKLEASARQSCSCNGLRVYMTLPLQVHVAPTQVRAEQISTCVRRPTSFRKQCLVTTKNTHAHAGETRFCLLYMWGRVASCCGNRSCCGYRNSFCPPSPPPFPPGGKICCHRFPFVLRNTERK
jgi:hypothetical protein